MQQSIKLAAAHKPVGLLNDVQVAHFDLQACLDALDELTKRDAPDLTQLTQARWRVAQARLRRRMLAESIYARLLPTADDRDANAIREIRILVQSLSMVAAAHISRWSSSAVENDWSTYCREAQEMRVKCMRSIESEQGLIYSLLQRNPWFTLAGSEQPSRA